MLSTTYKNLCIINAVDGLCDGLSHFSSASRAALIYAENRDAPIRIYDPQNLLTGHEPKLKEIYIDSEKWRKDAPDPRELAIFGQIHPEKNLGLAGLISYGGRSKSIFYQMWFTEHHPDMCAIGPSERWLEHAVWLLSNDFASENTFYTGTSGYVLREYATHAVRDFLVDEMNVMLGWDTQLRIYPILDAVLGISGTREEGAWPRGQLVFIEPRVIEELDFVTRFPGMEQPLLENFKHVRKLLLAVEKSDRRLVSDGMAIIGIAAGRLPKYRISADFKGRHGFLRLNGDPVCSFSEGKFHSTTYQAKMVQLEEILIESDLDTSDVHAVFKIVSQIVHFAEDEKFGCMIVIDLNDRPVDIPGQTLMPPLDLRQSYMLEVAKALAKVDGALHVGIDMHLHRFACLLDGKSVPGEDRARGARFNSALRFTAGNQNIVVVVVSSDQPVYVIQEGVEMNAQCVWEPVSARAETPPMLESWIESGG
jgi:hypothetical protein